MSNIRTFYVGSPQRWHDNQSPCKTANLVRLHQDDSSFKVDGLDNRLEITGQDCHAEQSGTRNRASLSQQNFLQQRGFLNYADLSAGSETVQNGEDNYVLAQRSSGNFRQKGSENSLTSLDSPSCSVDQKGDCNTSNLRFAAESDILIRGNQNETVVENGSGGKINLQGESNLVNVSKKDAQVEVAGDNNGVHIRGTSSQVSVSGDDNYVQVLKDGTRLDLRGSGLTVEVGADGGISAVNGYERPARVRLLPDGGLEVGNHLNLWHHLSDWLLRD